MKRNNQVLEKVTKEGRPEAQSTKTPESGAFKNVSRSINEREMNNPVVARILLDKIDELKDEKTGLKNYCELFHQKDKEAAILSNQASGESKFQKLYSLCLTVGGIIFGVAFATQNEVRFVLIGCGLALLIVGGVLTFAVNRN